MLRFAAPVVVLGWFGLAGCSVEILHDIDEAQANQVLDALNRQGIGGHKQRVRQGSRVSYTISVPRGEATRAWRLLRERDLPRATQPGLGEVFGDVGLVPTATQERAMMRQALAGELSRTLQSIDGVRTARVHVVLPKREALAPRDAAPPEPRAAVLLKVSADCPLGEAEVKKLVAGSVEGLNDDAVNVVFAKAAAPLGGRGPMGLVNVGPFAVARTSRGPLLTTLIVAVLLILALSLTALFSLRHARALRRRMSAVAAPGPSIGLDSSLALLSRSLRVPPVRRATGPQPHSED